jgi:hypothetical protein
MDDGDVFIPSADGVNLANMATTPRDMLIEALHPGIYTKDDDVEKFISKCTRYFDASGIQKSMRSLLVLGLLEKNLRDRYESTESMGIKGFEDRMRKAFPKSQSVMRHMEEAVNYRRNGEDAYTFEKKIDSLVDNLMQHQWDRETLKKELLVHCCNDLEIRRDIKMRDLENSEEIMRTIKKFESVREDSELIGTIRSYKAALVSGTKRN